MECFLVFDFRDAHKEKPHKGLFFLFCFDRDDGEGFNRSKGGEAKAKGKEDMNGERSQAKGGRYRRRGGVFYAESLPLDRKLPLGESACGPGM